MVADERFVRRRGEIDLDLPAPRRLVLEGRRGRLGGVEPLDDDVRDAARGALVADELHEVGGAVGRQTFEHGRLLAQRREGVDGQGHARDT